MSKIVALTIEENGDLTFLATDSADIFLECGEVQTQRASHVEPANFFLRIVFVVLRTLFADTSRVAEWTRGWSCLWRVNTSPVGGPILRWRHTQNWRRETWPDVIALWTDRKAAIQAEVTFLNDFFTERGN